MDRSDALLRAWQRTVHIAVPLAGRGGLAGRGHRFQALPKKDARGFVGSTSEPVGRNGSDRLGLFCIQMNP
jgi:hypothetical protein